VGEWSLARLELEKPTIVTNQNVVDNTNIITNRRRIQEVQCCDRWTGKCLNEDCWAFQNVNGNYFCTKNCLQNQSFTK
jgi:hypothetical protein